MPAASRRTKREPQEDIEEQPAESSRKPNVKKSKQAAAKRQAGSEDEDDDMDGEDEEANDDIIDVDNFGDQPIRHGDAKKLQNLVEEWAQTMSLLGPHALNLGAIGVDVADAAATEKDKKVCRYHSPIIISPSF